MSEFKIKVGAARQVKSDLNTCSRTLGTIYGDIGRVKRNLRWKVQNRDLIDYRLNSLMRDIDNNKSIINNCSSILDQAVNAYCSTESSLVDSPLKKALQKLIESPLTLIPLTMLNPLIPISILTFDWETLPNISDFIDIDSLKEDTKKSHSKDLKKKKEWSEEYIKTKDDLYVKTTDEIPDGFEEITDEDELKKVKKEYDDFEKAEKALNDAKTIYEKEISADYSLYEKNGKYESGDLSNEYNVKFGSAEAYAKAAVTDVGLSAEIGISTTAISAEDTVMLGDDNLGIYGTAQVEALKAEAKADAQVGIVEIDGKKVLAAHAGASAEAILVDASLKAGAKVLGTDVSANVGVNVGIGAHADVGFQGGKLKVDIGASLGVGVSADFEVDFSGTIDAVCSNATNIANTVSDAVNNVSNAVNDVSNAVNNAANAVSDSLNKLGNLFGL